ncbi:MAG: CPBP family intramembrane metalloprotease [Robiginitomaculum sp.]|nr:CPBP family intramembrane metalloprotease [Robiginitomaculum sp.]
MIRRTPKGGSWETTNPNHGLVVFYCEHFISQLGTGKNIINMKAIMSLSQTPIQSFLSQTQTGNSKWWSWIIGFWFALVIWFYGQIVLGVGMQVMAMITDPEILQKAMAEQASTDFDPNTAMKYALIGLTPIIPVIFWFLRHSFKSNLSKQIASVLSALVICITSIAFVKANLNAPAGSEDIISNLITSHPINYALILLTFPVLLFGLWLSQKFIHSRSFLSLLTAAPKFRWGRMAFAMLVMWAILAIASLIGHVSGASHAEFVFNPSRFWIYLPVTLLLIPLQSATEEIALRGYLNQGIGHYIKNPWIVFVITSAAFASLHLGNPEIAETTKDTSLIIAMSGYFLFGLFACVLTYIDGGLESAIGMHAANNIFAASLVGYDNSALPTPTVFKVPLNSELDSIIVFFSLSLICLIMYKTRKPTSTA